MFNSPMLKRQTQHYIHLDIKKLHELDNGGNKDKEATFDCSDFRIIYFLWLRPDGHRPRWWHDGWWLGVGNDLRMVFYDHYRDSRYFGYRFYDETKVTL